jgi:uroporphyrinogen decarboxylase
MRCIDRDVHKKLTMVAGVDSDTHEPTRSVIETGATGQFVTRRLKSCGLDILPVSTFRILRLLQAPNRGKTNKLKAMGLALLFAKGCVAIPPRVGGAWPPERRFAGETPAPHEVPAMTSKERIIAALEHREADRVPFWESYWGQTIARWRREGLPEDVDPGAHFGLDPTHHIGYDWSLQLPTELIEDNDEYTVTRTNNGALAKNFKGHDSTPLWWDFKLTDRASWEELKPRTTWNETRIDLAGAKAGFEATRDLFQVYACCCLGFEKFKYLMGTEGILIALAADPDWAREMCMSTAEMAIDGLDYLMANGLQFDAAFVTEDMGYKGRPFFSPRTYREVIMPCQKLFCEVCHARGIKVMLHTCGQNMELVPLYIEAGFDALNPLEVKAGMDIFALKRDFGEALALWGGIDVRAIANPDPSVLEREIREKVTMAKQGGGYIFSSDHSIPENVSLKQYEYMLELGRECGGF